LGTSLGIGHSNIGDTINRQLVVEAAIVTENTTVTVRGIFAKTDVTANEELRETAADDLDSADDGALGVIGSGA
jgi:hypothetical protein